VGRLLIATHLDQSNHLPNQKQGIVRTRGEREALKALKGGVGLSRVPGGVFPVGFTGFDSSTSSKKMSSAAGSHILNVGGGDDDALSLELIIFLKLYQTFYFD